MSPAAISALLISIHGAGLSGGRGGGVIVGFTGSTIGGGFGIGFWVLATAVRTV